MRFLLDTNVVSEWMKPAPHPSVSKWLTTVEWLIPVPVLAELEEGANAVKSFKRRNEIRESIRQLAEVLGSAVIDWDAETALLWGSLRHSKEVRRQPQALWDSLIDALAVRLDATIATRNTRDFRHAKTFDPWKFSEE